MHPLFTLAVMVEAAYQSTLTGYRRDMSATGPDDADHREIFAFFVTRAIQNGRGVDFLYFCTAVGKRPVSLSLMTTGQSLTVH